MFFRILTLILLCGLSSAYAGEDHISPKKEKWSFDGAFGEFDRNSVQRGLKVYQEVCAACHGVKRLAFRNLMDIGFSEGEVKTIAAGYNVQDGPNDDGEIFERLARPSDYFPGPYANDKAARASNNGGLPTDLSLIIKARVDGANYIYSLLTGFIEPPKDFVVGDNMHYNPYFAGGGSQLLMTPPLIKTGQVTYDDGTEPSVDQMSRDVVNFLQWVAEPEMEARKRMGIKVMIFVVVMAAFAIAAKHRIWRRVK